MNKINRENVFLITWVCCLLLLVGVCNVNFIRATRAGFGNLTGNISGANNYFDVKYLTNYPDDVELGFTSDNVSIQANAFHIVSNNNFDVPVGYEFVGWNTHSDGSGEVYEVNLKITITEPLTLYAQWELINDSKEEGDNVVDNDTSFDENEGIPDDGNDDKQDVEDNQEIDNENNDSEEDKEISGDVGTGNGDSVTGNSNSENVSNSAGSNKPSSSGGTSSGSNHGNTSSIPNSGGSIQNNNPSENAEDKIVNDKDEENIQNDNSLDMGEDNNKDSIDVLENDNSNKTDLSYISIVIFVICLLSLRLIFLVIQKFKEKENNNKIN